MVSRVREAFGVEIALRQLFERPVLAAFAEQVEAARSREGTSLPPLTRAAHDDTGAVLSYAQERMWFLYQLEPDSLVYQMPMGVRLLGVLDVTALRRSLTEVVRRHKVLRTCYPDVEGRPWQEVSPARVWPLPVVDLAHLDPAERRQQVRRISRDNVSRAFDLTCGPVFRTTLAACGTR